MLVSTLVWVPRTGAEEVRVVRGPYLQLGGPTGMTVVWNTNGPSDGAVEYGTAPSPGALAIDRSLPATTHVVALTGLEPGTTYYYALRGDGRILAEGFSFKTFPAGGTSVPFRLAAWGDSGSGDQNQLNVAAKLLAVSPDLAIHVGDAVYESGEAENFDPRYFQPYASLVSRINVYNALGNHEMFTLKGQPYIDAFYLPSNNTEGTERYYSLDYGDVHFICLDTNQAIDPESVQRRWLESDLATMGGAWTVVFHHHSPFTTSWNHAYDLENTAIRMHLSPLYERFGVDLVLTGHSHSYERTYPVRDDTAASMAQEPDYLDPDGPIYITTGGGGGGLYPRDPAHPNSAFQAVYRQEFHLTALDFAGGVITGRAVKHDGTILDAFTLTKTRDAAPPVISELAATEVTETTARIAWLTDEPSDSTVEYGPIPSIRSSKTSLARATSHSAELRGLFPGFEYQYRVLSRDRAGNLTVSATRTFFTAGSVSAFRLDVDAPAAAARTDPLRVTILGTSPLPLHGFTATLRFDPGLVELTGSGAAVFEGTPWADSDRRDLMVDPEAGEILLRVTRDASGTGAKPPIDPPLFEPFAHFELRAGLCTGPAAFDLDNSSPGGCLFVVEDQGPRNEAPRAYGRATMVEAGETFIRGDASGGELIDPGNPGAVVSLADALHILDFLFLGGPDPPCLEAADVNADARITIVDAVFLLRHLFGNPAPSRAIPAPWPGVGRAPEQHFSCAGAPASACGP